MTAFWRGQQIWIVNKQYFLIQTHLFCLLSNGLIIELFAQIAVIGKVHEALNVCYSGTKRAIICPVEQVKWFTLISWTLAFPTWEIGYKNWLLCHILFMPHPGRQTGRKEIIFDAVESTSVQTVLRITQYLHKEKA